MKTSGNGKRLGAALLGSTMLAALCAAGASAQDVFPMQAPRAADDAARRPVNRDAQYNAVVASREKLIASITPVTDAMLRKPADGDWLHWRRTYDSLSFSPLKHITKDNVSNLRTAWIRPLPVSVNETTPLVHDGVLFIQSGISVQALNAATGEMLWEYVHSLPHDKFAVRDARMKNIALYEDKLYAPMPDGRLVALEAKTGKLVWSTPVIAPEVGVVGGVDTNKFQGGPIVAKGMVVAGLTGGNKIAGGGYIVGVDARTGKQMWRFNTVTRPGEPGGDTWNGAPFEQRFGSGVWTAGSYDPERNLVYLGTGNTYNIGTLFPKKTESNDALYTNSTLALDPQTGKLAWYYQHLNRDVWDMDWTFERSLLSLPVQGKNTDVVVTAGKIAIFDVLERATGKYVSSIDLGLQNYVTSIDPVTGKKTTDPALEPVSGKSSLVCPSPTGARNWPTTAYDAATGILYVPMLESCADYVWTQRTPAEIAAGGADIRLSLRARPDTDGKFGRLQAIDLKTGKTVWTHRQRAGFGTSLVATAGGIVFSGDFNRTFRAFDSATGAILWETTLDGPANGSPITYEVNGEQYVAFTTGSATPIFGGASALHPEIQNPFGGIRLWVLKLPKR